MKSFSYLHSATSILQSYNGNGPFHLFIKKYFSANKKFGSRDRKQIASLCYNHFRLGHAAKNISLEERIQFGTFLCENKSSEFLKEVKPEWNDSIEKSLEEKLSILNYQFPNNEIFPFENELSKDIDAEKFSKSFLIQPKLFLRIRPGNKNKITGKLAGAGIPYELISENCIALANSSKINEILELDKEAVIQDYNSQQTGKFLQPQTLNFKPQTCLWDCCSASGGKSIMAYDIYPNIQLTVSDKRSSILENLHKRFANAGIKKYDSFVADLTDLKFKIKYPPASREGPKFDLIIADVPCTGSGTWSRTPEQLYYFKKDSIEKYSETQKQIAKNVILYLKTEGHLLYITCSVFKKENEDVVKYMQENSSLRLIRSVILKGYEIHADTMFAALFIAK